LTGEFTMNLPLAATERVWAVGSLCHAAADALDARFNPVAVRGEISGYSRAPSGHCYFTLKDAQGQLRCAMFRRAAGLLDFVPRDGELVEVRGRLGVYEPRGDLQLVVVTGLLSKIMYPFISMILMAVQYFMGLFG
jgi:exodeoxyribonuclease VII large subunit